VIDKWLGLWKRLWSGCILTATWAMEKGLNSIYLNEDLDYKKDRGEFEGDDKDTDTDDGDDTDTDDDDNKKNKRRNKRGWWGKMGRMIRDDKRWNKRGCWGCWGLRVYWAWGFIEPIQSRISRYFGSLERSNL